MKTKTKILLSTIAFIGFATNLMAVEITDLKITAPTNSDGYYKTDEKIIPDDQVEVSKQILNCIPEPENGGEIETEVKVIDNSNITSLNEDFTLEGKKWDGSKVSYSYYTNGNGISGFGVSGKDKKGGNPNETGEGEEILINFEKNLKEIEISFSWLQINSWVTMEFYNDNELVGKAIRQYGIGSSGPNNTTTINDVSVYEKNKKGNLVVSSVYNGINYIVDLIDPLRTYKPTEPNAEFNKIRIYNEVNPKGRNDWLINTISYKTPKEQPTPQILGDLLYSEPMIISKPDGGAYIYDSSFEIGNINTMKTGRITKKTIGLNNTIVTLWDTIDNQETTNVDTRKIYTTHDKLGGLVEFNSTKDNQTLKEIIFPHYTNLDFYDKKSSDTLIQSFITWYRGTDILDEDRDGNFTENRSLLGDVYNSNIIYLNTPNEFVTSEQNRYESYYRYNNGYSNFVTAKKNREKIVLAASNDGMIHAFSDIDGKEKWAYIPPFNLSKIGKMIVPWMVSNSQSKIMNHISNSMFTMDGKILIKDVFIGGNWKTLLFASAGKGGRAITVLDITDTTSPKHYFSVENDIVNSKVKYWNDIGALTISDSSTDYSNNPYKNLGKTYNKPIVTLLPTNVLEDNIVYKWQMVFGAGKDGGKGLFLIDLENPSSVVKFIDMAGQDISTNDIPLNIVAELSGISAETTRELYGMKGVIFYFADTEGTLWRMDASNKVEWYSTLTPNRLLTIDSNSNIERMNYTKVIPYIETNEVTYKKELYLTYGTGNLDNMTNYNTNAKNLIINFKDKGFPTYNEGIIDAPKYYDFTDNYNPNKTLSNLTSLTTTLEVEAIVPQDGIGWYVNLDDSERIFSDILVSDHILYANSFILNQLASCGEGVSYLYAINTKNGIGTFTGEEKRINTGGKITNLTSIKNSLILTLEKNIDVSNSLLNSGLTQIGNLIVGKKQGSNETKPINILNKKEVK